MNLESYILSALKKVPYSTEKLHFVRSSVPTSIITQIEDFTQSDFGPHPREIELDNRNWLALMANSLFNRHLKRELAGAIEPSLAGQYLPTYHVSLYKPQLVGNGSTRTHELAHAYARNRNPFAMRLMQLRFGALTPIIEKHPASVDLMGAQKIIQEGFATWVAAEVTGIPTHFYPVETTRMSFDHYKNYVEYRKSIAGHKPKVERQPGPGAAYAPYFYGGRFVGATVGLLKEASYSQSEAINAVLGKCPRSVDDLLDPRDYAFKIQYETDPNTIEDLKMIEATAKILLTA